MKRLLPILCFVFACSILPSHAQNLVANPSFENWASGKPSSWTITAAANGTLAQDTAHLDGVKSCKMVANLTGNFHELYQYVNVTPGKTYKAVFSYYIYSGDNTDAGIWCNFKTSANGTNIPLSLTDSLLLKGPGGLNGFFPNILGSWRTYTCKVVAPAKSTVFRMGIRTYKTGTVSWDNCQLLEDVAPVINKSVTTLSGFTYTFGSGPSAQQSFTISGSNLTSSMTVKIPDNYEMSTNSGTAFTALTSPFTISQSGGLISPVTLYVRLKAGLAQNSYTGDITLTSGSLSENIPLSGSVTPSSAVITTSKTSLSGFTYVEASGPSTQQSFTLSGSNLSSGITVTPPASNYEISISPGTAFTAITTPFTITQSGGIVSTTTIYVRLKAGLTTGSYSDNITLSTTGVTKTLALSGTVTAPTGVIISTTSLTGFNYFIGAGPSNIQLFSISATGLSSSVVITPPANFEISDSENPFIATGMILLVPSNGSIASTPIYARLKSGLPVSVYNENITVSSTGFASKTLALKGNVLLSTGTNETLNENVRVYTHATRIVVDGTAKDEIISLYSITGMRLQTIKSQGEKIEFGAQAGSVYLVRTASKTFKVVL